MDLRVCENCGHPIRTNKDRGMTVNPNKAFHWIENYGSKQCPYCDCSQPLSMNPSKRYKTARNGNLEELTEDVGQVDVAELEIL